MKEAGTGLFVVIILLLGGFSFNEANAKERVYNVATVCSRYMAEAKKLEREDHRASDVAAFEYWEAATQMQPNLYEAWFGYLNNIEAYFIGEFNSIVRDRPHQYTLNKLMTAAEKVIELRPDNCYGYVALAECYAFMGDFAPAMQSIRTGAKNCTECKRTGSKIHPDWEESLTYTANRANKGPRAWIDFHADPKAREVVLEIREILNRR